VDVKTGIVGNVMMLKVKMTNPLGQPWLCTKIEINLAYKSWEFPCTSMMWALDKGKMWTLSVAGRTT